MIPQKNRKDKLFNDLINLVMELKLKWRSPSSDSTPFLKKLINLLWYIDGQNDTIEEKSNKIPDIFCVLNVLKPQSIVRGQRTTSKEEPFHSFSKKLVMLARCKRNPLESSEPLLKA